MIRRSISTALAPLLVGLLIALNAPTAGADAPCFTDGQGNCAEQVAASNGQSEYDMIRTALEMASAATTIPVAVSLAGPASEPYQQMTSWSVNF